MILVDPLIGQGPALVRQLTLLYPTIINRARVAWGVIFHASDTAAGFAAVTTVFGRQLERRLADDVRRTDPDLVVSVHPLLNHVAARAIDASARPRGLVTVVTDLVDVHRGWICNQAELIVVPTEQARANALQRGANPDRVRLLGLPVDLSFRPAAPGEKAALRRRFGLDEDRATILMAGGGEGSGRLLPRVRQMTSKRHPWQLITVCGRNQRLQAKLAEMPAATPNLVLGFVDNMPELMRASDLLVTKAGPGSTAEAMASELPLLLTGFLPGQEASNVDFVVSSGLGVYAPQVEDLEIQVKQLLGSGRGALRRMERRMAELSRPYAALDIARQCLARAQPYMASGQTER